jgi:hypothetical protein
MTFKTYEFLSKKRRGLSSVVGALLFVVLMVATFAVLGVALDSQTNIVDTGRDVADLDLKIQQEKFTASMYSDGDEKLIADINNGGQNAVEISTIFVTNSTQTEVYEVPSDTSFVGPNAPTTNVLSTTTIKFIKPTSGLEVYNLKAISSLGTIKYGQVVCSPTSCLTTSVDGSVSTTMFLEGSNSINTHNVTAILFVSNNSEETITDLQPTVGFGAPLCDDLWTADTSDATVEDIFTEDILNCQPVPGAPVSLGPHETKLFRWTGTISGDIGVRFTFCSSVSGNDSGGPITSPVPSCATMTVIDPNDCGGCGEGGEGGETIILIDDLLIKPSIFMTIPSPFGDSKDGDLHKGLWGVNVANPTDQDMTISKVTVVAFPPGGNAGDVVFSGTKSGNNQCLEEDILPLLGPPIAGYWDCPRDNTLMWQNFTSPVLLKANSTESFMVKVRSGDIFVANTNLDALIVQANVYRISNYNV